MSCDDYQEFQDRLTEETLPHVFDKNDFNPWKDGFDYAIFILAASTGMGTGELLTLEWSAVHLEEGKEYLEIRGSMQPSGVIGPIKGKRPRATPIFDFVLWPNRRAVTALHELRSWNKKHIGILNIEGNPEGPVFAYLPNQRADRTWFQKRLGAALKASEIQRDRGEGVISPDAYSFRHTYR